MINIRHTLLRLMIKISYKRFSKRSHKINSNNVVGPERALHCPGGCPTRQFAKLICTKFAKQTDRAWEGITPAPGTACWVRHRPAWQQNTPSAIFDLVFIKFRHFLPADETVYLHLQLWTLKSGRTAHQVLAQRNPHSCVFELGLCPSLKLHS